ncbi:hypothetical protein GMMP1_600007 [Candidatus Magnetomoraceae bacterium gMMP-1]
MEPGYFLFISIYSKFKLLNLCTGQKIDYPNKNKLFQKIIKKAYFNLIL